MVHGRTSGLHLSCTGSTPGLVLQQHSSVLAKATVAAPCLVAYRKRGSEQTSCSCVAGKYIAAGSVAAPERAERHTSGFLSEASEGVHSNAVNGAGISASKNGTRANGAQNQGADGDRSAANAFHVEWRQDTGEASPSPTQEQEPEAVHEAAARSTATEEKVPDESELARRQKISAANKGKLPWNTGRRHSPETIQKIREATYKAMLNPEVRSKLSRPPPPHSAEVKEKVREKLKQWYALRRGVIEHLVATEPIETLKASAAALEALEAWPPTTPLTALAAPEAGREPDPAQIPPLKMLQPSSAEQLLQIHLLGRTHRVLTSAIGKLERQAARSAQQEQAQQERAAARQAAAEKRRADAEAKKGPQRRNAEHRAKIADSIRRKWQDPEFRSKMESAPRSKPARSSVPTSTRKMTGRTRRKALRDETDTSGESAKRKAETRDRQPKKPARKVVARTVVSKEESPGKGAGNKRRAKIAVAQQLADELEAMLTRFSDQDMEDENSGVRQSVEEAQALVVKAKACVERLSGPNAAKGSDVKLDELESALLVLDRDRS